MANFTIEKNEMFDLAFRFVTETNENIFLTGKAGTGKTTFLKYLQSHCSKNIIVAAPTGVAAINAGGVTLHSLFHLPFHPYLPTKAGSMQLLGKIKYNRQRIALLRKMELLVIDEISMVRADVMDAIDAILRSVRRNFEEPFGGVQLLCIGDLHQLPPVAQHQEWQILQEYYSSPFFFDSMSVREQMPLLLELNKIYRQKEDFFVNLLNKVRNNNMNADDFEDLHTRYIPNFSPGYEDKFITLTSHNKQSDLINANEIEKLLAASYTYKAEIDGDFNENAYPADKDLVLKKGAQVMFLKNDVVSKRYFNGKIGVIKTLEHDKIVVESDGEDIEIGKETWENTRYVLNREDGKLEQETLGTFTQYALRLAWAITIHKSQGLTFERVMIDAGAAFSSGQVYVALSRCTSLEGIVLLSKIPNTAIYNNENVVKGQQSLQHRGSLADRFAGARQVFTYQLINEIFSFERIAIALRDVEEALQKEGQKFNIESFSWLKEMKQTFANLRAVGANFVGKSGPILQEQPVVEENELLQSRINDACKWFLPQLISFRKEVNNHPLNTEHKDAATLVNEGLQELLQAVLWHLHLIEYCASAFSVSGILMHKLAYVTKKQMISCYASANNKRESPSAQSSSDSELQSLLIQWRNKVVEEINLPIYLVAGRQSITEICTYLPQNKKELQQISGFGPAKVNKYGDEILDIVLDYCHRNSLTGKMSEKDIIPGKIQKAVKYDKDPKISSKQQSFDLFAAGKTIDEIAAERGFAASTIENHLSFFVSEGKIDIDRFVTAERQEEIKILLGDEHEGGFAALVGRAPHISYFELRLVNAALSKEAAEADKNN